MNTRTLPPPVASRNHHLSPTVVLRTPYSTAQLAELMAELRREYAFAERELSYDGSSLQLHELRLAMQRLEDGEYGICSACGEPIAFARLQVMPAAQRCVGCPPR